MGHVTKHAEDYEASDEGGAGIDHAGEDSVPVENVRIKIKFCKINTDKKYQRLFWFNDDGFRKFGMEENLLVNIVVVFIV